MKIALASDHAGFALKAKVAEWLKSQLMTFTDFGTHNEQSVDYPDFAHKVATLVEDGTFDLGILICGTGIGVDITANKHQGIRSALCWNKEIARLAKSHNNANIISLPGRFITGDEAGEILKTFMNTTFEGGRHQNRLDKVSC